MKKFRVTVTRTTEYEVTVDDTKWGSEAQKDFERYMWDLPHYSSDDGNPDVEAAGGFAKALAEQSIRLGVNTFIEGFGKCGTDKELVDYWNRQPHHKDDQYVDGLYISEEDDDIESEIEEMED